MDKPEFWVENLWLPLVVGLVLLLAGATFSKAVRRKVWAPLWRALLWVGSVRVRVTTTGREDAEQAALDDHIERLESEIVIAREVADGERAEAARTRGVAADAANQLQGELDAAKELNKKMGLRQASAQAKLVTYAREEGREQGRAEAKAEVAAQREAIMVRPVWRVVWLDDPWTPDSYELKNVQPGVGAMSDVRLEPRLNTFLFNGPSQWPGQWPGPTAFRGERAGTGKTFEVEFDVHYRDQNGDWRQGLATLARPSIRPVGGVAASRDPDDPLGPLPTHF